MLAEKKYCYDTRVRACARTSERSATLSKRADVAGEMLEEELTKELVSAKRALLYGGICFLEAWRRYVFVACYTGVLFIIFFIVILLAIRLILYKAQQVCLRARDGAIKKRLFPFVFFKGNRRKRRAKLMAVRTRALATVR